MRRLSMLFVIAISLVLPTTSFSSTSNTPDDTVRRFYAWYVGRLNAQDLNPLKNRTVALQYLTPEYLKKVPRLTREADADVIICAQDFDPAWEKNVKTESPSIKGTGATVMVQLVGSEMGSVKLKVTLKSIAAGWRIDGVECAE
jgi:hypothetical protein